jgi:hypothetical protein
MPMTIATIDSVLAPLTALVLESPVTEGAGAGLAAAAGRDAADAKVWLLCALCGRATTIDAAAA